VTAAGFDLPGGESTAAALRRTEQERDEARLLLDQYKEAHRSSVEDYNRVAPALERCRDRWETAQAERDLARAELASARQELEHLRAQVTP
jgi:chromosome segregation ATPase